MPRRDTQVVRLSIAGFALAALFLAAVAWNAFQRISDLRASNAAVNQAIRIREEGERLRMLLTDAETGERGFLITGAREYLQPYEAARDAIPATLQRLESLTSGMPGLEPTTSALRSRSTAIMDRLALTIDAQRQRGSAAADAMVASGEIKRLMDQAEVLVDQLKRSETRVADEREAGEEGEARAAFVTTAVGLAAAILFLAGAGALLLAGVRRREAERAAGAAVEAGARAVAESEERLRVTVMSIGDAVAVTDAEGRVTRLNPVAEALSGWSAAEAIGRPLEDVLVLVNERTREPAESPADRVLREGTVVGLANHTLLVRRDGSVIPIDDSAAPIRGVDGAIVGVVMVFRDVTERRRQEREAAQRVDQEHARVLASAETLAHMGSWRLELPTNAFICSAQLRQIFGLAPDAAVTPDLFFGMVHPGDREAVQRVVNQAIEQRSAFRYRGRIIRPDGTVRVLDTGGEIEVQSGKPRFLFGFARDVTEEVRAEEALRVQTELYEKLLGAQSDVGDGVAITEGSRLVYVNDALARIYGYSAEELRALPNFLELVVPEERERLTEVLQRRLAGASPDSIGQTRIVRKDGRRISVEYAAKAVQGRSEPLLISIIRDVTDRLEAEAALRDQKELYERLLGVQSDVGLGVAISEGARMVFVNDALARMYGYSVEELMAMPSVMELVEPAQREGLMDRLARRLRGEPVGELGEVTITRKDGRKVVNAYAVKPVQVKGKTLIISLIADVTESRKAEEAIRQLSRRLLRVQDEEQERIARELKSTVGKSLDEVLARLAAVRDSGTVFDWKTSEALRDSLRLAQEAATGVRTLSRLLYPPMLDEEGLAEAIRWYSYDYMQSNRVKVALDVPLRFPRLARDAERALFRVVQESLTNVARHSGSPSAAVRLREENGTGVRLEIQDTGKGIPPEILERTRGTVAIAGVGIRGMVERMRELGGSVEISSDGFGTTVTAVLPVAK